LTVLFAKIFSLDYQENIQMKITNARFFRDEPKNDV